MGLLLMVVGTIIGCACGMIKVIPRAVLLGFAVVFIYILALLKLPTPIGVLNLEKSIL